MKIHHLMIVVAILLSTMVTAQHKTLHDFTSHTSDGELFDFSQLKGKKVLLVNTATQCSLSPQLGKLQKLYEEYGGDNFEIIMFPCNDFRNQEPGDNLHVKQVCTSTYNISFPIMEKITIKGEDMHPIYHWLTNKAENGHINGRVLWNFQKFMIDEHGKPVDFLSPLAGPHNRKIIKWLQEQ